LEKTSKNFCLVFDLSETASFSAQTRGRGLDEGPRGGEGNELMEGAQMENVCFTVFRGGNHENMYNTYHTTSLIFTRLH